MSSPAQGPPLVDWTQVKEDILCPLCDYNLRGLSEPRCPECGYRFEWLDMLDPQRRRHPYLFEHHPERNVWSFFKTLCGGLWPGKFWTSFWAGQSSAPRRLLVYWLVVSAGLLLGLISMIVSDAFELARVNTRNRAALLVQHNYLTRSNLPGPSRFAFDNYPGGFAAWLDNQYPLPPSSGFFWQLYSRWDLSRNGAYAISREGGALAVCLLVLIWPWLTLLALLVFQSSMFEARIETIHVVRCVIYSSDVAF